MNSKSSRELLCITGSEKNYALDLKWIAEIYADVHISPFPCLPPHYIGMYNYKGQIIPVISLEEAVARILIIIRCNDCLFALAVSKEPFIIDQKDVEEIDSLHPDTMSGLWAEQALYQMEGTLVSLLDIQSSVEKMQSMNEKEF